MKTLIKILLVSVVATAMSTSHAWMCKKDSQCPISAWAKAKCESPQLSTCYKLLGAKTGRCVCNEE